MGEAEMPPIAPMLEIVIVPPLSSAILIIPERAASVSLDTSAAISNIERF